ncbi:hypothetical protein NHH03_14085 [Stieleria sp. TO1_6]|nr:hypothetical protein [Stieleria tagensis]
MTWTNEQIDVWMKPSKRTLMDANGDALVLEQTALFWEQFDELVDAGHFTVAQLIGFGNDTMEEFTLPFNLAIQDAVGHLYADRFA